MAVNPVDLLADAITAACVWWLRRRRKASAMRMLEWHAYLDQNHAGQNEGGA